MIRFLLIALTLLAASPAGAQSAPQSHEDSQQRTYTQADLWNRRAGRITFTLAGINLPDAAGTTRLGRSVEASREGRGLDNALIYTSADEAVFATVYIYAPALPDAALTAFMTDHAIHLQSGSGLRTLRNGVVAAGGRDGVAIRADYAGFRENRLASSAAFMRVGGWIVKLRVSGPEARRAEVESAMNALLRDIRFEGRTQPGAIVPVAADTCRRAPDRPARLVRSDDAETMEDAITAHNLAGEGGAPPNRQRWCRSAGYSIPDALGPTPVLRDENPGTGDDTRRRVLIAIWGDNGTMVEVMERRFRERTRFVVIHHQIGQTTVLGAFDSVPTDAQLQAIATGADREGGRARATIIYQANGDSSVNVQVAPAPAPPRT
jgi:hypothetical protein